MSLKIFKNRVENHYPGISLSRAMLCDECKTIFDVGSGLESCGCPHCESKAVAPISKWLNRPDLKLEIIYGKIKGK